MERRRGSIRGWWERHATACVLGAMGACVLAWAAVTALLAGLDDTPGWWPGLDPSDPAVVAEAETLERAFANQVSMVREGDGSGAADWKVRIGSESANAWLAARLRAWVESEGLAWPDGLDAVGVGFLGDRVALGARLGGAGGSCVAWVSFTPEVRADGSVWLRAHGARVGSVPVPRGWALSGLERELAARAPELAGEGVSLSDVLGGRAPVVVEPVVRLPDGRRVRVVELAAIEDGVGVVLRTEGGG